MDTASIIGLIAGVLTTCGFIPQVIKTIRSKSTKDISLGMFLITGTGLALWLLYGILSGALPVIIANAISFPLACVIIGFKLKYK